MKKLLISGVTAVGLVLGFNGAMAQNVKSDQDKARGEEKVMQHKEKCNAMSGAAKDKCMREMEAKGAGQNQTGQGEGTTTSGSEGTQSGHQDSDQSGAAPGDSKRRTQ
jgi:hypothetical protein